MKPYLERFLLPILASLFTLALTGKTNPAFRVAAIATVAALAFLAAFLVERFPSSDTSGKPLSRRWRLAFALLSLLVLVAAAYVLVRRSEMFQPAPEISTTTMPLNPEKLASNQPKRDSRTESSVGKMQLSREDNLFQKYVSEDTRQDQQGAWTVLISAAEGNDSPELRGAAESALSEKGYAVRPLFRATLLQDSEAYDELYSGNPALLKRIGSYRDAVLIGKLRSEVSQNTSLDMFTAHLFVDLRVISARPAKMEGQFTIDETGAGFSEVAATTAAEHRMADKLKQQLLQSIPSK